MKTMNCGRIVFGASAILFGVIALLWHDAETWQTLRQIWSLPSGLLIGECLMAAQIAGGIAILIPRAGRLASVILGVVYFCFSLACIPAIVASPSVFAQYESFCEQFSMLCGAMALFAATGTNAGGTALFGRLARMGLGVCAMCFAVSQVVYLRFTAQLVPKWIPPSPKFWVILTTIGFALAAIALLLNRQARLAARLLTLMLGLFGVLVWIPRVSFHPRAHGNWSECALTFLICGAAWIVAESSSQ
ncbi:MAG TPA: hypothetical protein VJN93_08740 [Candidatus Acidoferrum sp.]|nr:hypothetical protein [Candidatus Acidoferrum sp.]